jgi:hypothetical protein
MARVWMETFEDNPEADFVYGGYGLIDGNKRVSNYSSEEFDAYKLTCYNYIDGGFPIKREIYQEWDISCKSLNDWEWWLRLVRDGARGKFIKDITYLAEVPKVGGLSDDSSKNWLERVDYIKKKLKIPERDICVSSLGAPTHAIKVAQMLGADYKQFPGFKPNRYKLVYLLGFYKNYREHSQVFLGLNKDCVKVVHWVGADIYWLRDLKFGELQYLMKSLAENIDYHFVECKQMQEEMAMYGIKTQIVPIPPATNFGVELLPKEFTVAIMKTDRSDFDKYLGNLMDEVMAALPNIKFKVFGDGKCNRELSNVTNMGFVKMEEFVPQCSAILRIVRHDGMMMALNEFVMAGRDAISNLKMPFIEFIDTSIDEDNWDRFGAGFNIYNYPDTKAKIIDKILSLKDGTAGNKYRWLASSYYRVILNKGTFKRKINSLIGRKTCQS